MAEKVEKPETPRARSKRQRLEALTLRRSGARPDRIAKKLGVTTDTVNRWLREAYAKVTIEAAEQVVKMELERLDDMTAALWPTALKGNNRDVRDLLSIMDRRARLLKLDSDSSTGTAEVGSLLDRLLSEPPKAPTPEPEPTPDEPAEEQP